MTIQVIGNLGLMAMRCNSRVMKIWDVARESVRLYVDFCVLSLF